jgi:hypothetical protein
MSGGRSSNVQLDVSQCTLGSDIFNADGTLECNRGGFPPSGSYQNSCRLFYVIGPSLFAQCKNDSNIFVGPGDRGTSLPSSSQPASFGQCLGDILNFDGELHCSTAPPPGGSYLQSCSEVWFDSGVLHAHCRRGDGSRNKTSSPASSNSNCSNQNGNLAC